MLLDLLLTVAGHISDTSIICFQGNQNHKWITVSKLYNALIIIYTDLLIPLHLFVKLQAAQWEIFLVQLTI